MSFERVSEPSDPEVPRRRVEAAFRKAERGKELTEKEVRIVRWESAMNRCHPRGSRVSFYHGRRWKGGGR